MQDFAFPGTALWSQGWESWRTFVVVVSVVVWVFLLQVGLESVSVSLGVLLQFSGKRGPEFVEREDLNSTVSTASQGIIQGQIIDAFAEMRNKMQEDRDDLERKCFVSSVDRCRPLEFPVQEVRAER